MTPWSVCVVPRDSMMPKLFAAILACGVFYLGICLGHSAGNTLASVEI